MKRLKYMLDPLTGSIAFLSFAHWEYSSLIQVLLLLAHCHQVRLYVGMLWVLIGAVTWLWEEITKTRWGREIKRRGGYDSSAQCYRHVHVEYQCEVARIFSDHESAGAMDSSLTTHTSSCSHSLELCVHCVVHTSPAAYTSGKAVHQHLHPTTSFSYQPEGNITSHYHSNTPHLKHTCVPVTWQCSSVVLGVTPVADTTRSQVYTGPLVKLLTWSGEEDVALERGTWWRCWCSLWVGGCGYSLGGWCVCSEWWVHGSCWLVVWEYSSYFTLVLHMDMSVTLSTAVIPSSSLNLSPSPCLCYFLSQSGHCSNQDPEHSHIQPHLVTVC